jgi:hypothetical protein
MADPPGPPTRRWTRHSPSRRPCRREVGETAYVTNNDTFLCAGRAAARQHPHQGQRPAPRVHPDAAPYPPVRLALRSPRSAATSRRHRNRLSEQHVELPPVRVAEFLAVANACPVRAVNRRIARPRSKSTDHASSSVTRLAVPSSDTQPTSNDGWSRRTAAPRANIAVTDRGRHARPPQIAQRPEQRRLVSRFDRNNDVFAQARQIKLDGAEHFPDRRKLDTPLPLSGPQRTSAPMDRYGAAAHGHCADLPMCGRRLATDGSGCGA